MYRSRISADMEQTLLYQISIPGGRVEKWLIDTAIQLTATDELVIAFAGNGKSFHVNEGCSHLFQSAGQQKVVIMAMSKVDFYEKFGALPRSVMVTDSKVNSRIGEVLHKTTATEWIYERQYLSTLTMAAFNAMYCERHGIFAPKAQLSAGQIVRIAEFVRHSLHHDVHLRQMANEANLSEFHFSRMFRNTFGISPYQFVLKMKIERAKGIMASYPKSLSQIAHSLHFTDQAHFTNVFKKITGLRPTEYLQQVRQRSVS
jgi:AraC-like DNA-binding protein